MEILAVPLLAAPFQRAFETATNAMMGAASEEVSNVLAVTQRREELARLLRRIHILLLEQRPRERRIVQEHYNELFEVATDAQDVLDEFATDVALLSRRSVYSLSRMVRELRSKRNLANQLASLCTRLRSINSEEGLGIQMVMVMNGPDYPPQDHIFRQDHVFLRAPPEISSATGSNSSRRIPKESQELRELLLRTVKERENDGGIDVNISIISIFGVGGVGKTTLAGIVYKDGKVRDAFEIRMWIRVSRHFDRRRIVGEMLSSLDARGTSEACDAQNVDAIRKSVQDRIRGKRLLLVLDDVPKLDPNWRKILEPLEGAARGSKVLVTTRDLNTASRVTDEDRKRQIHFRGLSEVDVLFILTDHAFAGRDSRAKDMEKVCQRMCNRLGGSALAAKIVGRLLGSRFDLKYWKHFADELPQQHEDGIMPVLRICYERLPLHLRECFAYCSVFPHDYVFEREELVHLWMAQGFVRPTEGLDLEDGGRQHLDDLVYLSLLQSDGCYSRYVMPGLIHDLARSVAKHNFMATGGGGDGGRHSVPKNIHHLSWFEDIADQPDTSFDGSLLDKCQSLRSLHFFPAKSKLDLDSLLHRHASKKLKRLRVLRLENCDIISLPAAINNLKHLRYLDLRPLRVMNLPPQSLDELWNLQFLRIQFLGHNESFELPEQTGRLTNLRHLQISFSGGLKALPGVPLQKLINLKCLNLSNNKNLTGLPKYLSELSNLEDLHLDGCHRLASLPDKIGDLKNLKRLSILNCHELRELPASIETLRNAGCALYLPDRFRKTTLRGER